MLTVHSKMYSTGYRKGSWSMNERHQNIILCSKLEVLSVPVSIVGFHLPLNSKYPKVGSVWAVLGDLRGQEHCNEYKL